MTQQLAILLHLLSAVIWVGGMFFAYMALRPAAGQLEPPIRLTLWVAVFQRFFPWVWGAIIILPLSGYFLAWSSYPNMASLPLYINLMQFMGWAMILIYLHVYFASFKRLKVAVTEQNWPEGGKRLGQIRLLIGLNLLLGLCLLGVVAVGRYGLF